VRRNLSNTIKDHFTKNEPKEACGVLVNSNSKVKFIRCKNISPNLQDFAFCPDEYIKILLNNEILGIVHNHVQEKNTPSEYDIDNCNALAKPYYIYSYPDMKLNILLPKMELKEVNK